MARLLDREDKQPPKISELADTKRNVGSEKNTKSNKEKFTASDRKNIKVNPDTMLKLEVVANNFFDRKMKQYELQDILVNFYIENALESRQQKILKDLLKQFN